MKSLVMGVGFQGRISRNPTRQIGCLLAKKNYNSDKENVTLLNGMGVVYRRRSGPRLGPGRPPAHEGRERGRGQARERAASGSGLERAPGHQEPDATGALRRRDRVGDTRSRSPVCGPEKKKMKHIVKITRCLPRALRRKIRFGRESRGGVNGTDAAEAGGLRETAVGNGLLSQREAE